MWQRFSVGREMVLKMWECDRGVTDVSRLSGSLILHGNATILEMIYHFAYIWFEFHSHYKLVAA